ncbi:hypothetical protein ACHAWF_010272 [Thalassiosira exigua]
MFNYANPTAVLASRRMTSSDRPANEGHFHRPYDGGSGTCAGSGGGGGGGGHPGHRPRHSRSSSDFSFGSLRDVAEFPGHVPRGSHPILRESHDEVDNEPGGGGRGGSEPMDYEGTPARGRARGQRGHGHQRRGHQRYHSEPVNLGSVFDFEHQVVAASDHLLALLQKEANDYSDPPPAAYYPAEFAELAADSGEGGEVPTKKATIGPWRKRIASWMYDVVDHFRYDRNVVSVALRYIDRYVGHLLEEHEREGGAASAQPIKRRHFQLIAVTSLYLSIKVHGELMEDDPVSGAEYDVVASLVHEVDGRAFLGHPLTDKPSEDEDAADESEESDEDLRDVSRKLADLKRRHRKGRWSMGRFSLPLVHPSDPSRDPAVRANSAPVPKRAHSALPYKPRKRGLLSGPLRLHSFVELSRGLFAARDITDTERRILEALRYAVNPPTSRRFAGELLRMLALGYGGAADGRGADVGAAEGALGMERKAILGNVLRSACEQIEGAAGVPALSIGRLPSAVAYGAILNAVDEEFDRIARADRAAMEAEGAAAAAAPSIGSPQLEDFQKHYRRYSVGRGPHAEATDRASDKELFLEAWRDQFLTTVFRATDGFLDPDAEDVFQVRELLLDHVGGAGGSASSAAATPASSPTEGSKVRPEWIKKRSPRSPTSVAGASRGGSSFRLSPSSSSSQQLISPYDSQGRATGASGLSASDKGRASPFRSLSTSGNGVQGLGHHRRAYYKQTSEPIQEQDFASAAAAASAGAMGSRFSRAQTPEVSQFGRRAGGAEGGWRSQSTTGEAFLPPNPSNPVFFSA